MAHRDQSLRRNALVAIGEHSGHWMALAPEASVANGRVGM